MTTEGYCPHGEPLHVSDPCPDVTPGQPCPRVFPMSGGLPCRMTGEHKMHKWWDGQGAVLSWSDELYRFRDAVRASALKGERARE